jgi:DNA-binding HxlR family transcriptional regulator
MTGGRRGADRARRSAPAVEAKQAAITVLGDRANLLIIREAFRRTRRYQEFKERLGVSDAVLASRLHDLVDIGVLQTVVYTRRPPRHEYRLTDCGIDFWQTLIGIWMWEKQWGVRAYGRLPVLTHLDCGNETTAVFGCGRCAEPGLRSEDITVDLAAAVEQVGHAPLLRYRRASWKPARSIDLYSEIDSLVGDRWTVATLSAALLGVDRFGDLQRALKISPPLLSQRLSDLVDRRVLERVVVPDAGAHHRYHLTDKGRALMPVIVCNYAWATTWFPSVASPRVPMMHAPCDGEFVPAWFCADCGKPMDRSTMTFDVFPASTPSRTGATPR